MTGERLTDVSKIAVLRANVLGDLIFVLPALKALRETYPKAEIVFLGKAWHKTFIPGRVETVDRVVVVPPYAGVGEEPGTPVDEAALEEFFAAMRQEQFDVVIQLYGGGRYSNPFISRFGARLTVGLQAPDAPPLDRVVPYVYYQNEMLRYLEVVSLIGAKTSQIIPQVTPTVDDMKEAAAMVAGADKRPYILMHPGASDPRRRWPTERFGVVANHFIEAGFVVYVTGTDADAGLVRAVVGRTNNRAIGLAGKISLGGLAALSMGAALVLSNDTGPLHLATAVNAKTVGIYWCGNLINASPMTRTNHRPLLSWTLECAECKKEHTGDYPFTERACRHDVSFVSEVTTDQAIAACEALLAS